jgi:hypothetical protein
VASGWHMHVCGWPWMCVHERVLVALIHARCVCVRVRVSACVRVCPAWGLGGIVMRHAQGWPSSPSMIVAPLHLPTSHAPLHTDLRTLDRCGHHPFVWLLLICGFHHHMCPKSERGEELGVGLQSTVSTATHLRDHSPGLGCSRH